MINKINLAVDRYTDRYGKIPSERWTYEHDNMSIILKEEFKSNIYRIIFNK